MKIKTVLITILLLFSASCSCFAATYYISPGGNDSTGSGTSGSPWATISKAIAAMSGGDTLICKDGTYTGESNVIWRYGIVPPVGSAGAYTTIKAENDGKAIFDGENTRFMFNVNYAIGEEGNRYWQFEGLVWCRAAGTVVSLACSSYVKFLRCGAYDAANGNNMNFSIARSNYVLLEGCYAYGSGRYKFLLYRSNNIILRNCVGRMDWVNSGIEPIAIFSIYSGGDIKVQNCIGIDSSDTSNWTGGSYQGTFFYPSTDAYLDRVETIRCIGLKNRLGGISTTGNNYTRAADLTFTDCVIWDCDTIDGSSINVDRALNSVFNHCTFGYARNINYDYVLSWDGIGYNNNSTVKNSIFYSIQGNSSYGVLNDVENCNYNSFYDNTRNYLGTTPGINDRTNINPIYHATTNSTGALKYITRVEAGSNLAGLGESGSNIGATLSTLVGTPGTLWGEAGYDTDTGVSMWPFPNEDIIRTNMKAYSGGGVSGNRGFCADGTTLTKYIWEFLGNTIPPEIYGTSTPTITTTSLTSGTTGISYNQTLGFKIERKNSSDGNYAQIGTVNKDVIIYTDSGLETDNTYYYRIRAYYNTDNSSYSNEATVTLAGSTSTPTATATASSDGGGGGGKSGCFIATATYGSYDNVNVKILRQFRDKKMLTNRLGHSFVQFYYKHSPRIASYIAKRPYAKYIVRDILKPIVWFAEMALKN